MRKSRQRMEDSPAPSVSEVMDESRPDALDRRTTIYMATNVWKTMRHRAVEQETNLSQVIDDLCRDYLEKTGGLDH